MGSTADGQINFGWDSAPPTTNNDVGGMMVCSDDVAAGATYDCPDHDPGPVVGTPMDIRSVAPPMNAKYPQMGHDSLTDEQAVLS